jgi:hypothetical protein
MLSWIPMDKTGIIIAMFILYLVYVAIKSALTNEKDTDKSSSDKSPAPKSERQTPETAPDPNYVIVYRACENDDCLSFEDWGCYKWEVDDILADDTPCEHCGGKMFPAAVYQCDKWGDGCYGTFVFSLTKHNKPPCQYCGCKTYHLKTRQ